MQNNQLFQDNKDRKLLSLYFCAGCPTLEGTGDVIKTLQQRGIDMIEVGVPFSDPMADGPVIQAAATKALKNGMTLRTLFSQLKAIKDDVQIPLILMGYLNVMMQFGFENFFIGMTVEHIDMSLRLGYKERELSVHFDRLFSRLRRSKMPRDGKQLQPLWKCPCRSSVEPGFRRGLAFLLEFHGG